MRHRKIIHFDQRIGTVPDMNAVILVSHDPVMADHNPVSFNADRSGRSPRVRADPRDCQSFNPVIPHRANPLDSRFIITVKDRRICILPLQIHPGFQDQPLGTPKGVAFVMISAGMDEKGRPGFGVIDRGLDRLSFIDMTEHSAIRKFFRYDPSGFIINILVRSRTFGKRTGVISEELRGGIRKNRFIRCR
ncbi:MAG: hypothetical protein BWY49_00055 [Candidatus Omnitrophica bacterium ADurb.Bin314]|nr:MAG: hypothetical protein BWY49_00055 [Candidatus Omnitrophica bacterium ADurb.Bin314]